MKTSSLAPCARGAIAVRPETGCREIPRVAIVANDPKAHGLWSWLAQHARICERDPAANAVVIECEPARRAAAVIAALERGQRLIVASPLCRSPLELESIEGAARAADAPPLMVAESAYFAPTLLRVRRLLVAAGCIRRLRIAGVRPLSRALATVNEIVGANPSAIHARSGTLELEYESGTTAQVSLERGHCRVDGEHGTLRFGRRWVLARVPRRSGFWWSGFRDPLGDAALRVEILRYLTQDWPPYADLEFARRDLDLLFRARAAGFAEQD